MDRQDTLNPRDNTRFQHNPKMLKNDDKKKEESYQYKLTQR